MVCCSLSLSLSSYPPTLNWSSLSRMHILNLKYHLVPILSQHPTKPETWKRFTKKQICIRSFLSFLNDCDEYYVGDCDFRLGRPLQHWSITLGNTTLSRASNLRIWLLVGCDGLEKDAAHFRYRNNQLSPADPSCKLCSASVEDALNFTSSLSALDP